MDKEKRVLIAIFLLVLAVRLFLAFQTPFFSYDAYFNIRQIEYISHHGKPFFYDELSYGNGYFIFPPLFHYSLAFLNIFLPLNLVAKIIPNIFASFIVFAVYLISKKITKNKTASFFSAFVAGFLPIFLSRTINTVSVYSLFLPIMFFAIYCLLNINEGKKYITYFIILIFIMPLIHQMAFLFLFGLLVYLLLIAVEKMPQSKAETEIILFSVFVISWIQFLIYKNAFLQHGLAIIWQNIPKEILGKYFTEVPLLEAVYQIGVIPFIFGIFIIYLYIFRKKSKETYLLFGFAIAAGILLWLRLIQIKLGLMFLGIFLAILFAHFYKEFVVYLEKTKADRYKNLVIALFLLGFILTSVVPSLSYAKQEIKNSLTQKEISEMEWIKENTKNNSIILASLTDSYAIEAIANRRTMIDPNFLLVKNIDQRYSDFKTLFTTYYETDSVRLLNEYGVKYIYFSENAKKEFGVDKLHYTDNKKCFDFIEEDIPVYESLCTLEET